MSGANDMDKSYDPHSVEERWYGYWEENGLFNAVPRPNKKPYTIVIPPPNVTDVLHLGHGLNNTIQDVVIRWKRMQGYEAEWMPGTDHAGIATQNVVERKLAREGKTRWDLGREEFLEEVWQWVRDHRGAIITQLKKLGCSCDWGKTRFTMDEGLSKAVVEAFVSLYEKGLIYRGKYIINWCPRCGTALSDEEAEHDETQGHLWYIRYPFVDGNGHITVATTRPETMLGDTAVAVNPSDERYVDAVGKTLVLPLVGREIPVIEDNSVDPGFGTGAVKVTPAHDPNDFEISMRHKLPAVCIMNEDGTMSDEAGAKYAGMDRFKCREMVIEDLEKGMFLEKVEDHAHSVGRCYRCNTVVEPYLSNQWFVKMKPLAEPAIRAAKDGRTRFYPERWAKVYLNWLENIRDWCISRQIWWGHRIPVWYCQDCGKEIVSRSTPSVCPACSSEEVVQDEDVLDTWFSSWLWPFSTFGWPEKNEALEYFYPTDTLSTAPEIIFFWVARMVMAGFEFMGDEPFSDIYLHGTVRDKQGRKMSKSLGNTIDPLDIIKNHGADSLRFSILVTMTQDIYVDNKTFEVGKNFANKIWNAARFVISNLNNFKSENIDFSGELELADRWILSRLQKTISSVDDFLGRYRFNDAALCIYDFIWHDYCDWYLELIKPRLYRSETDPSAREEAQKIAAFVLDKSMRLLHPFMPFITEEIWQRLIKAVQIGDTGNGDKKSVMISLWPVVDPGMIDPTAERDMEILQGVIGAVRNIRSEMGIPPDKKIRVFLKPSKENFLDIIGENIPYIVDMTRAEEVSARLNLERPRTSTAAVVRNVEIFVPLEGIIDLEAEKAKLTKEIERLSGQIAATDAKLRNESFLRRAPAEVVDRERSKREEYSLRLEKLEANFEAIKEA